MKWGKCKMGSIKIDGAKHTKDVILDHGEVRNRRKKASREFKKDFGHTPLSLKEEIPWDCKCLIVGTGMFGHLAVMDDVKAEAQRRAVKLTVCTTPEAVQMLKENPAETNAILHVTC